MNYRRVLLKISGEVLRSPDNSETISTEKLSTIAGEIAEACQMGVQIAIVIGGGNIFRGRMAKDQQNLDRATADYMGMLATMINGLALMGALEKLGVQTRVQNALPINPISESFILRKAIRHLEKNRIVIFVAGTGNPYFSTDTAAALRASEIRADILMKATQVDGVYEEDPRDNPKARRFETLEFNQALQGRYAVMDSTAFSLCMDNQLPILIFNINQQGNIKAALEGRNIGTLVSNKATA